VSDFSCDGIVVNTLPIRPHSMVTVKMNDVSIVLHFLGTKPVHVSIEECAEKSSSNNLQAAEFKFQML